MCIRDRCLSDPLVAFIRLQKAMLIAHLTEVCVPTRFIFIQLGPVGNQQRYHEVGRSIATLMSDEVSCHLDCYREYVIYKNVRGRCAIRTVELHALLKSDDISSS